jgi:WD40 repeat protein
MRRHHALLAGAALAVIALAATPTARIVAPETHLSTFAFCPDGQTLVGREGGSGWLIAWPGGDARRPPAGTDTSRPPCPAASFGYSPDGKWWATVRDGSSGVVLRGDPGAEVRRLSGHLGTVYTARFSPDGRYLATSGADNDVRVWDAKTWVPVTTIDSMTFTSFALAWSPDSRVLYTGGSSRNVTAWSTSTWSAIRSSTAQRFVIGGLSVSADGRWVAASTWDADASGRPSVVLVLDASSLAERVTIPTSAPADPVAFSPDGKSLVGLIRGQAGLTVWPME